ncbi:hypothetical protein [Ferrovibrio sp.]|uniref:hypothetical protein n=1 Tax=Ferrovibrio sp. TaxID=1917215 RepID=UPI0025B883E5|nr:hypothetical protein [Ferrovibrio sp.]MBX3456451.1 hypothetical protein [Ferrovibrio sp.]
MTLRSIAAAALLVALIPLAGCVEDKSAPSQRHTGISDFTRFISKTGSMKGLKTYFKTRSEIPADEGLGVIYDGARNEGEVYRFRDPKVAGELLPALKAVRKRLGESENCMQRGYFIACGEEKFIETFRKWE